MCSFFVDTIEVPEDIEMDVKEFSPFHKQTFIDAAKKYVDKDGKNGNAFYYIEAKSNAGEVRYFKEEPQSGYSSFFFQLDLSSPSLPLAIDEGIRLAEELQVNCFEILEGSTPICYMYNILEWIPIAENNKYREPLTACQRMNN